MMPLYTKPTIQLPRIPPQIDNEEIREYLVRVNGAVEEFVKNVYNDLSNGRVQHRVYTSVPTTSDVEEGEIVFYKSGSTVRIYVNVDGTMKYVAMKEVE